MVSEKITNELIEEICKSMKMFDETAKLPSQKIRIDITLSNQALNKLKDCNRSDRIEKLILNS